MDISIKKFLVKMPDDLHKALKIKAADEDTTMNEIAVDCLTKGVAKKPPAKKK